MATTNEVVLWNGPLKSGLPKLEHFNLQPAAPPAEPQAGEVQVELVYLSVDPYLRGRMNDPATTKSYIPCFQPGQPLDSLGLVKVVKVGPDTADATLKEGAYGVVWGLKWQKLQVVPKERLQVVDEQVNKDTGLPLSVWLGALGMTGFTAYSSLERIGKPKAGETAFVSGAAGAVGLIVGQLLKNVYGLERVVGSAGTDEKVALLLANGYDAATNYKTESVSKALPRLVPKGLDLYYDNVGGEALEAALDAANTHARVVACGSISGYNSAPEDRYGVKNLFQIVTKRILMQGFIQGDYADMRAEFYKLMPQYIREGKVKNFEHVVQGGLAAMGQAFIDMMQGANIGKMVIQCGPDPYRKA